MDRAAQAFASDRPPGVHPVAKQGPEEELSDGEHGNLVGMAAPEEEGLTMTGQAMGTLDYMPPEQALDTKTVDGRADIYSLGCTLHYLLTGRPPYRADTLAKKLAAHRTDPIPSLREKRPEVPECLEQVYRRMLAKTPDERQQTMQEVVTQLEECVAAGNLTAEPGCFAETVSFRGEALPGPTAQQSTVLGDVQLVAKRAGRSGQSARESAFDASCRSR